MADLGRDPFAHDHGADDDQQNQRDLRPVELRDRGVELKSDAAGADQAEHRRFADIDVPAKHRDSGKSRQDLRHDPIRRHLRAGRAGRAHRFDLAFVDLLDRLVKQLGAKADRAQRDRDDAGENPGPIMVTSISAQISALIERDETMMNSASGRTTTTLGVVLRAAQ